MKHKYKHKITIKGTIEIEENGHKERVPIKIVSSNEDNSFIQSVQFFSPCAMDLKPNKFKDRLKYFAKSIGQFITDKTNGDIQL